MIEAMLLVMAIGFIIVLLRNASLYDKDTDEPTLGLFSYKEQKADQVIKNIRRGKQRA